MSKDRSLVRASDLGLWTYCHRAWWLAQVKGVVHRNPEVLERGTQAHVAHGTQVQRASRLQVLGLLVIGGALLLLVAALLFLLR